MTSAARATDFARLFADAPSGLRYLSLDCFDTLIWRNTQMPRDVFADLGMAGVERAISRPRRPKSRSSRSTRG